MECGDVPTACKLRLVRFITLLMGLSSARNEKSAPPYIFAVSNWAGFKLSVLSFHLQAVSVFFFAWLSDKYHMRALFLTVQMLMTIIGLVLTAYTSIPGWRYTGESDDEFVLVSCICFFYLYFTTGIFLANAGSAGCIPGILAYVRLQSFPRTPASMLRSMVRHRTTSSHTLSGLLLRRSQSASAE